MSKVSFNSGRRHRRKSRSSYASAALCIAAVAIAICAAAIRVQKDKSSITSDVSSDTTSSQSSKSTETTQAQSSAPEDATSSQTSNISSNENDNITDPADTSSVDEYEDFEDSEQTLAIQTMGVANAYIRPVGGAITKDYNMSGLVYSITMGDWRVHNGLDISANKGEIVKAAAEGVVAGVINDTLYGTTVVINQNDGLMVYYRGLTEDTAVKQGENVAAGATLGTVGDIPCESGDGSHLHIEVMRNNEYLNPSEALGYK